MRTQERLEVDVRRRVGHVPLRVQARQRDARRDLVARDDAGYLVRANHLDVSVTLERDGIDVAKCRSHHRRRSTAP